MGPQGAQSRGPFREHTQPGTLGKPCLQAHPSYQTYEGVGNINAIPETSCVYPAMKDNANSSATIPVGGGGEGIEMFILGEQKSKVKATCKTFRLIVFL